MPEKFVIEDDVQAAWALRKFREAERRLTEIWKVVEAETQSIQDWADSQREKVERERTVEETENFTPAKLAEKDDRPPLIHVEL